MKILIWLKDYRMTMFINASIWRFWQPHLYLRFVSSDKGSKVIYSFYFLPRIPSMHYKAKLDQLMASL